MTLRFGTDGVRGLANAELTPELALALGRAAARVLGRGRFVVGRDTRRSGPLLEAALAAGLASEGVRRRLLGVVPTPAVAVPLRGRRRLPARDDLGVAQPVRRQRHQALRPRRAASSTDETEDGSRPSSTGSSTVPPAATPAFPPRTP